MSYVFKEGSAGITANSERYVTMLRNILQSQFEALRINIAEIFFQQDGVIGCMSNASMVLGLRNVSSTLYFMFRRSLLASIRQFVTSSSWVI